MFLVNSAMVDLSIGTAGLVALLGYAVVFVGLIALMVVILIEGKIAVAKKKQAALVCAAGGGKARGIQHACKKQTRAKRDFGVQQRADDSAEAEPAGDEQRHIAQRRQRKKRRGRVQRAPTEHAAAEEQKRARQTKHHDALASVCHAASLLCHAD